MARLIGVHEMELLPGVNEAEFERFVIEELLPGIPFKGWTQHLAKGDRGVRNGKYAIIIEVDTADRDRYSPADNQLSEEGQRLAQTMSELTLAIHDLLNHPGTRFAQGLAKGGLGSERLGRLGLTNGGSSRRCRSNSAMRAYALVTCSAAAPANRSREEASLRAVPIV